MNKSNKTAKTILIVEDEPPLREILAKNLQDEGYDVVTAPNGQSGIDELKTKKKFDLVLLDIVMPQMDGFLTLETMQSEGYNIPTIVLSNISQGEERSRASKLGAKGYIVKSDTTLAEIVEQVKSVLQ